MDEVCELSLFLKAVGIIVVKWMRVGKYVSVHTCCTEWAPLKQAKKDQFSPRDLSVTSSYENTHETSESPIDLFKNLKRLLPLEKCIILINA